MKKFMAPTDMTLISPFSMGILLSWFSSIGVAKYPDFAGVTSLRSWPPKFASCVVFRGGAVFVAFRAPCRAKPMANDESMKKAMESASVGMFVWVSMV